MPYDHSQIGLEPLSQPAERAECTACRKKHYDSTPAPLCGPTWRSLSRTLPQLSLLCVVSVTALLRCRCFCARFAWGCVCTNGEASFHFSCRFGSWTAWFLGYPYSILVPWRSVYAWGAWEMGGKEVAVMMTLLALWLGTLREGAQVLWLRRLPVLQQRVAQTRIVGLGSPNTAAASSIYLHEDNGQVAHT